MTLTTCRLRHKPGIDEAAAALSYSQAELDAARRQGFEQGRTASENAAHEAQAEALEAIENTLASAQNEFTAMLAGERDVLKTIAAEFLNAYCVKFSAANALALANDLLDQLMQNSTDRAPARLMVSTQTHQQSGKRLQTLIDARGANFITLVADPSLAEGECRIDWRGGAIARDLKPIREAVADFINAERPPLPNPEQEQ